MVLDEDEASLREFLDLVRRHEVKGKKLHDANIVVDDARERDREPLGCGATIMRHVRAMRATATPGSATSSADFQLRMPLDHANAGVTRFASVGEGPIAPEAIPATSRTEKRMLASHRSRSAQTPLRAADQVRRAAGARWLRASAAPSRSARPQPVAANR